MNLPRKTLDHCYPPIIIRDAADLARWLNPPHMKIQTSLVIPNPADESDDLPVNVSARVTRQPGDGSLCNSSGYEIEDIEVRSAQSGITLICSGLSEVAQDMIREAILGEVRI